MPHTSKPQHAPSDTITMPRLEHERDTAALFRLRSENERLREALESISAKLEPMQQGERNGAAMGMASQARDIARAALGVK